MRIKLTSNLKYFYRFHLSMHPKFSEEISDIDSKAQES